MHELEALLITLGSIPDREEFEDIRLIIKLDIRYLLKIRIQQNRSLELRVKNRLSFT